MPGSGGAHIVVSYAKRMTLESDLLYIYIFFFSSERAAVRKRRTGYDEKETEIDR